MEMPWHNLFSDMEMEDDDELFKQGHNNTTLDDEEALVLRDILQLHSANFCSESESTRSPQTDHHNNSAMAAAAEGGSSALSFDDTAAAIGGFNDYNNNNNNRKRCRILSKSSSSNSIASQQHQVPSEKPPPAAAETTSSPKSYILSFDDSNGTGGRKHQGGGGRGRSSSRSGANQSGGNNKKARNSSESLDHIMAERKRRQELTERFIALSATIPGLKKIDKASILSEAIKYVKQLQERVKKLEDQSSNKIKVESVSFFNNNNKAELNNSSSSSSEEGTASSKSNSSSNSEECHRLINNASLPEVEARALEKQVLVRIHCKKQSGVMLKIFTHLKALDLSVLSNSVLPFGDSALDITIIAQMGEKYKGTSMKELVKSLRMSLLESPDDILQQQQQR